MHRSILSLLSIFSLTAAADPLLSPQEALKKFTAPEGFSVDLIAAEPDIVQPIAFCWDARGRIWVVEAKTYPTRRGKPPAGDSAKPTDEQLKDIFGGEDRILIFADEDGDGKFETRKVFAEKLNLVSGIELGFGGVYVGAAPYLMHIPDKDGDDQPDGPPEILLDGWGWQDTHETLNSFIWGPDGWLYGCHGVFTHSNVGAPGTPKSGSGVPPAVPQNQDSGLEARATARVPINCHYWRYHPVRRTFEAYASGTSNSWGFDYNEYGDWFSEACVIPHFWHIIQGGYYLRQSNPLGHFNPYVYTNIETIADHLHYIGNTPHSGNNVSDAAGGGHAHCGLCIYNGDNFPPEYRGRAMMFNIHGQRINQEQLVPEGSGYVAKHLPDFAKANDKNFTGVALKVGPDGAVYFIDWYDKEKCHRPQPEVWDRSNGRIYRVKYDRTWKPWKGSAELPANMSLEACSKEQNGWIQRQRRRLTFEQTGKEPSLPPNPIGHYSGTLDTDEYVKRYFEVLLSAKDTSHAIPFLWEFQAHGFVAVGEVEVFLRSSDDKTRSAAIGSLVQQVVLNPLILAHAQRRLGKKADKTEIRILAGLQGKTELNEKKAAETFLPLAKTDPSPRVRLALASALQRLPLNDRWPIAEALIAHGEDAKDHNLPEMYWYAIEPLVPANPERALELAAKSQIPLVAQHIARRLAETDGGVPHLITALGKEKTAAGTVYLLKAALQGLKGRSGEPAPQGWDGAWTNIDDILARRSDAKPLAAEITDFREALAVAFGDKRAFPKLRAQVRDTKLPVERRQLALQTLLDGKDPEIPSLIMALLDDPAMRLAALNALPRATGK
jgi:putative membrane-bound dehydrogenase-like protein